ncbi:MAG: hypothetical protein RBT62_11350 [Spirochaetia bacterium]|jgi:hypothetical protein|nr:hypothetical protein [Spirochaetia bacterium]
MLPPKTDQRWQDLLSGKIDHQFKLFSAGMCVSRHSREIKANPAVMAKSLDEVYAFFTKYEAIATEDLIALFGKE